MRDVVSANEAAHRFGLSEKTVRRWIRAGRLNADKHGRAYRVRLSEVAALTGPDPAHDGGPSPDTVRTADTGSAPDTTDSRSAMSGVAELVALVDRLQAEAREHATTAAMWQERAGTLADRLSVAESRLLTLAPPESPLTASTGAQSVDPTPGDPITDRWRTWLPWLLALAVLVVAVVLVVVPG